MNTVAFATRYVGWLLLFGALAYALYFLVSIFHGPAGVILALVLFALALLAISQDIDGEVSR